MMHTSEHYRCWYPLQIRFRDLDPLAHVNNSVYFIYFEEARSYYFDHLEPWLKEWPSLLEHQQPQEAPVATEDNPTPNGRIRHSRGANHYGMLVKEATCTYELPIIHSDNVEVGVRVVKIGRTSIGMEQQISERNDHSRIFATGRTVMVWCDYSIGKPYPVPPSLRAAIENLEQRHFAEVH
jgi:acyl-CoA thioester hydrolase